MKPQTLALTRHERIALVEFLFRFMKTRIDQYIAHRLRLLFPKNAGDVGFDEPRARRLSFPSDTPGTAISDDTFPNRDFDGRKRLSSRRVRSDVQGNDPHRHGNRCNEKVRPALRETA